MTSFKDAFSEPIKDDYADTGFALDGSSSKLEAILLFQEAAEQYDVHFDPKEMCRGYAHFHGQWNDYGEFVNGWWWDYYKSGRRGEKEIWLAYGSQLNVPKSEGE